MKHYVSFFFVLVKSIFRIIAEVLAFVTWGSNTIYNNLQLWKRHRIDLKHLQKIITWIFSEPLTKIPIFVRHRGLDNVENIIIWNINEWNGYRSRLFGINNTIMRSQIQHKFHFNYLSHLTFLSLSIMHSNL